MILNYPDNVFVLPVRVFSAVPMLTGIRPAFVAPVRVFSAVPMLTGIRPAGIIIPQNKTYPRTEQGVYISDSEAFSESSPFVSVGSVWRAISKIYVSQDGFWRAVAGGAIPMQTTVQPMMHPVWRLEDLEDLA